MSTTILELDRSSSGEAFIGCTELDDNGYGVRSFVLSRADEHTHDQIMRRRFDDMARLMDGNIVKAVVTDAFTDKENR